MYKIQSVMERKKYTVSYLLDRINEPVEPIANLVIPNITIPPSLQGKRRTTQTIDSIETSIRILFNSVTTSNLDKIKESFFKLLVEKAQTPDLLIKVASEMFENFLINEASIPNYLELLNKVRVVAVSYDDKVTKEKKNSPTLGYFFLEKCRQVFFENIGLPKVQILASLNQDDVDELDQYNKEKEKMTNLSITICDLYNQRNDKDKLCLHIEQIGPCLNRIVTNYLTVLERYESMIDEETGFSKDEHMDENEINMKMLIFYAEMIYIFLVKECGSLCIEPKTKITLDLIKNKVVPSLMVDHLVAGFKKFNLK